MHQRGVPVRLANRNQPRVETVKALVVMDSHFAESVQPQR